MFDYSHLDALLAVEREGSIDGAARSLGISGSAVSQRIKALEERIGAVTVNRQKRSKPTELGRSLCRHAEKVLLLEHELIEEHQNNFANMSSEANVIKLAVDETCISTWFPDAMKLKLSPRAQILLEVSVVDYDQAIELMKHGIALAAVSSTQEPVQGYLSFYLGSQSYQAVMTPEFARKYFAGPVDAEVIQACPMIRKGSHDNLHREWMAEVFGFELELDSHIVPTSHGILSAVLNDVGWAMCPKEIVSPYTESGQLVELIENRRLDKPLFWHYCRAVSQALRPINESISRAAQMTLLSNLEPRVSSRATRTEGTRLQS